MRHYEKALRTYGLTDDQYRRAVAAHELAHALVAITMPSLTCSGVHIEDHPQHGVHGGAWIGPERRGGRMDPYERAVELEAGAIAKACWLRDKERRWTSAVEQLVYDCAAGDRAHLDTLRLTRGQRADAVRDAGPLAGGEYQGCPIQQSIGVERGKALIFDRQAGQYIRRGERP